jgi:hypothetical protein
MRQFRPLFGMSGLAMLAMASAELRAQSPTQAGAPLVAAPSVAPIAARQVQIGDSVRVPLVVNDLPVGTVVDFRLDRLPPSAKLESGVIRWRPLRADANATYSIGIHALVNGNEIARGSADITVVDAHRPPIIRQPADRVIPPGDTLVLPIEASDPDGDVLSVAATNLTDPSQPPRYDRQTGTLVWQAPRGTVNRVNQWRVTVNDGDGGTATTELHVSVKAQNVAPVCAPLRTYKRDEGEQVEIALDADDANGDSLAFHPLATLPNGSLKGAVYQWSIPFGFVSAARQDSTVRFEWRASDPSAASTSSNCFALVTVFRSIAEEPFRVKQQAHRQLLTDVRAQLAGAAAREKATRDSLGAASSKKRMVKRASLLSALVGGLLQIAKSEDTRRIAAGISATFTVGLGGWESTLEDGEPLSKRAEAIAQERVQLQRALNRFMRRYGETVSREALLGSSYESDYQDVFDMLSAPGSTPGSTSIMSMPTTLGVTSHDRLAVRR